MSRSAEDLGILYCSQYGFRGVLASDMTSQLLDLPNPELDVKGNAKRVT